MAQDTVYVATPFVYKSQGLIARTQTDQAPELCYLNLLNMQEREENSYSSRYGIVIVNRDPDGTVNGQNYYFANPITSLARMLYQGNIWRYAADSAGKLYRRSGDAQGPYAQIYSGLSGKPFQSLITNCFETSQPFLFIYDADISIKDSGTGTPTLTGIDPPPYTANLQPYAPLLTMIDNFAAGNSYTTTPSAFSVTWAHAAVATLSATSSEQIVDFSEFFGITPSIGVGSFGPVTAGMLALLNSNASISVAITSIVSGGLAAGLYQNLLVTTATAHGLSVGSQIGIYGASSQFVNGYYTVLTTPTSTTFTVAFISAVQLGSTSGYVVGAAAAPAACVLGNFYSSPYTPQMSAWGFYQQVPLSQTSFPVGCWSGTVAQNATATVNKAVALDLSQNNAITTNDLIVLTLAVEAPANIAQITLQFNVGDNSGDNYYTASISPAFYQAGIELTQDAYTTTEQQIFADALGLLTGAPVGTTTAQLQPSNLGTSSGWVTIQIPLGNFLPVGQAGQPGYGWQNVEGYTLTVITNTNGGSNFSTNGLYLQWGYGESSYGGIGYDERYTYYDAATGTESNGCPESQFNSQYGYLSSLAAPFLMRQAAQITGYYSPDPQVTHVRMYRRGGVYGANWFLYDQVPNITASGVGTNPFKYKDVAADTAVAQGQPLGLANDPPVTSSLPQPVVTTLAAATAAPLDASAFATFAPQVITVVDASAEFVPEQVVNVGLPDTLEQVLVIAGGTGSFTAILRLQHNQGEPVYVYSVPRQPCNLCALAYGRTYLAGDKNNPHYLYFNNASYPESFSPANYTPVGSPTAPIIAVINWRGTLFVQTTQTWWLIIPGQPPQPTGSIHGGISNQGWTQFEGGVYYRAMDGQRAFNGADGAYLSLSIEFVYRQNPLTPLPLADPTQASQDIMCFYNNSIYTSYIATDGNRYRLIWDAIYHRYRNDDIAATAMLWEQDINAFLVAKQISPGQYAICYDQVYTQDYDDGGWVDGALVQTPIALNIQRPYSDLGKPHYPKQWNALETDVNTQDQPMATTLYFNTEPPTSIDLASATTTQRDKVQLKVNDGDGVQAYSMSLQHTMSVTVAPTFYQEDVYAAILADYRNSWDTYWIKAGTDKFKLVKQGYFDYTSTEDIVISLYADGSTLPYYQFTLPPQPDRLAVRKLFACWKPRLWRMIALSNGDFQFWNAPIIELKPIQESSTYSQLELQP